MLIREVLTFLESLAHPSLQEPYDNAGLITGNGDWECAGVVCCLDATEEVVKDALAKGCNLVVAHHPIIFRGLKKVTGRNYVERTIITAIKNDVAIYAIHTNLDNISGGVNGKIANLIGLKNTFILQPKPDTLKKLFVYAPVGKAEQVRKAIFNAGGGHIGKYSECSFNTNGTGTFKAGAGADPFIGKIGESHEEPETKIEVIFPAWLEPGVITAMRQAHPYEEVAYEVVSLSNTHSNIGAGVGGELEDPLGEKEFLNRIKSIFQLQVIRHTPLLQRPVSKVAVCGGAGSFLIPNALMAGVDIFITADIKYHEFFDANARMVIADIGHYESEQFTINLLQEILERKFPTFAVLKTEIRTNPVFYF